MVEFTWHTDSVPDGMVVRQVYGFCFDSNGRLIMRVYDGRYNLPGGRPESFDSDIVATLTRECLEELNIVIEQPVYMGYQCISDDNGQLPYAQIRMAAKISNIYESRPDPDNGRTYKRLLTSVTRAGQLLNWGDHGYLQAAEASRIAELILGLPITDEIVDIYV